MGKLLKTYLMPHPPIMVHEVGKGSEEEVQNTIKAAIRVGEEIRKLEPQTIILIVPPHGPAFSDANSIYVSKMIKGDLGRFGAPKVNLSYTVNLSLSNSIMKKSAENKIPIVPIDKDTAKRYSISDEMDHGGVVPLYFINKGYSDFKIVYITYGLLSNEELYHFGRLVREAVSEGEDDVVLITSGDLSHRLTRNAPAGYSPFGKDFDSLLVGFLKGPDSDQIMRMDRELIESAGECGYRSILIMLGSLDGINAKGNILSYEGPFGVGYCVASYDLLEEDDSGGKVGLYYRNKKEEINKTREKEDVYVRLARESLEHYIKTGKRLKVDFEIPGEMLEKRAGTFVSLKKNGELRGCIGTIEGVRDNIALEIIENAISAGTGDPRFYPVDEDELDDIIYSVDVLGKAEPIESRDELDPKRYGVIVRKGGRSGLLLPNLEGVDTIDEQLNIVLRKAGIDENEGYKMERFEVIRHR